MSHRRKWGSVLHVLIPSQLRDKLEPVTLKCRFIGYCEKSPGYRFFHKEKGIIEYKDATFLETLEEEESHEKEKEPLNVIDDDYYNDFPRNDPIIEEEPQPEEEPQQEIENEQNPMNEAQLDIPVVGNKRTRTPLAWIDDYY